METLRRFETVKDYNDFNNNPTLHPLVSVVDLNLAAPRTASGMYFGFYTIFLKEVACGDLRYGRQTYDYQEGTLVFIAPGQVISVDNSGEMYQPKGKALIFHADLLHKTPLGKHIHNYGFFHYASHEALHVSDAERKLVLESFGKIADELQHGIDRHTKKIIVDVIELFLSYCNRFYDRQFITRDKVNSGILEKLDALLHTYLREIHPDGREVLPSVAECAAELHLSAGYLGDLVKKETGRSAQEYIHDKLVARAKELLFDDKLSISEVAYQLGFKYPAHFSRFFKNKTGESPNSYRTAG